MQHNNLNFIHSLAVRSAKLAYIDSVAKPPREVRRQQLKYGTAGPSSGERSRKFDKFSKAMDPIAINREKREEKRKDLSTKILKTD